MLFGSELRAEAMADQTVLVDDKGDATGQQSEGLFDAKGLRNLAIGITEQREGEAVFGGKLLVRFDRILADSNHFGAGIAKIFVLITKGAGLGGAARRVISGIEINDERLFADQRFGFDALSSGIEQRKFRTGITVV